MTKAKSVYLCIGENFGFDVPIGDCGITKTLTEWAEFAGLNKSTLKNRYCDGVRGVMLLHKSENTKFKKGYNKYDNPRHYKDYKPPTIIEAEVSE